MRRKMTLYVSWMALAVMVAIVGLSLAMHSPTAAQPWTAGEIESVLKDGWGVDWDARSCIDTEAVANVDGPSSSICLRFTTNNEAGLTLVEKVIAALGGNVGEVFAEQDELDLEYVPQKIGFAGSEDWGLTRCDGCYLNNNRYVCWVSDREAMKVYLLAVTDESSHATRLVTEFGRLADRHPSWIMPSQGHRFVRNGLAVAE